MIICIKFPTPTAIVKRRAASWTSLAPRKCRTSSLLSAGLYELVNEEEEVENWGLRW